MKAATSLLVSQQAPRYTTTQKRQRLVTMAISLTEGTALAPKAHERALLDQFIRGNLTIDQVLKHLDRQEHE